MKRLTLLFFLLGSLCLSATASAATDDKVTICHSTGKGFVKLQLPASAVDAHKAHTGDLLPATPDCKPAVKTDYGQLASSIPGVEHYWPMGDATTDSVGGDTITLSGGADGVGPTIVPGLANDGGTALRFDGVDDKGIGQLSTAEKTYADGFSLSYWVKSDTTGPIVRVASEKHPQSDAESLNWLYEPWSVWSVGDTLLSLNLGVTTDPGVRQHLVLTQKPITSGDWVGGCTQHLYRNGVDVMGESLSFPCSAITVPTGSRIELGFNSAYTRLDPNEFDPFAGFTIDNVMTVARPLTQVEVTQQYEAGK